MKPFVSFLPLYKQLEEKISNKDIVYIYIEYFMTDAVVVHQFYSSATV